MGPPNLKIFLLFGALKFFSHENVMFHLIPNDVLRDTRKMEWHIDREAVAAAGCGVICIVGGRNVPQFSETSVVRPLARFSRAPLPQAPHARPLVRTPPQHYPPQPS